ncbi:MAG: GumC family protein [Alcanivorax sp.]
MSGQDTIDLKRLYFILKRHIILILSIISVFVVLAISYISITPEKYTAETVILLDKGITNAISSVSSLNLNTYEPAAIDSEVEVLKSKRLTDAVVKLLEPKKYFEHIAKDTDRRDFILFRTIQGNLTINRVEKTYALSIRYKSRDPQKAADIANAFAEVYIADQLDSLAETSERTLNWLQIKAAEIKEKSTDARARLSEYRTTYNKESLKNLKNKSDKYNQEVKLREFMDLEQEIDTYDTIYDSYLEKMRTMSLEQSFPVTETRVITYATAPLHKSEPNSKIILGAAIVLGTGLGILLALIIDFFDKTLRRAGQVNRELKMTFLGFLPKTRKAKRQSATFLSPNNKTIRTPIYTQSIDDEESLCAETIRNVKNVIDYAHDSSDNLIIGVISTFTNDDTYVIASNLAAHCSNEDNRTLLINGDIHLAAKNARNKNHVPKTLYSQEDAQEYLLNGALYNEDHNLHLLDTQTTENMKEATHYNAQRMTTLLDTCRKQYDYTIIDLPPLYASSNLHPYLQSIDAFVLLSEWGKALPNTVNFYLKQNMLEKDRITGVILNNANMKKMKSHYGHVMYRHPKK